MRRVIISCYGHEANPWCGTDDALVVPEIAHFLSREHEVVVISCLLSGCREAMEPFQGTMWVSAFDLGSFEAAIRRKAAMTSGSRAWDRQLGELPNDIREPRTASVT